MKRRIAALAVLAAAALAVWLWIEAIRAPLEPMPFDEPGGGW